jgi:tetratricopeptide (TPR) repeat protein
MPLFSKSAKRHVKDGMKHFSDKQYEKASNSFEKALEKKPEDHTTWNLLSQTYLNLNRNDEALSSIEFSLGLEPENVLYLHSKATILHQMKRLDEAAETLDKVIAIQPGDIAYILRGVCEYDSGRYENALEWYEKALMIDPENPLGNQMKGYTLFMLKRFEETIPLLEKSLSYGLSDSTQKILDECKKAVEGP